MITSLLPAHTVTCGIKPTEKLGSMPASRRRARLRRSPIEDPSARANSLALAECSVASATLFKLCEPGAIMVTSLVRECEPDHTLQTFLDFAAWPLCAYRSAVLLLN